MPSVPCKECACLSPRWMCGEGEQEGSSWWPCQPCIALACVGPASPSRPFPEGRHLHVALQQLPQQRVRPGGFPPWPAVPAGATGAAVPTHQRNPLAGHTRSTGSHFCIQHRRELRSCPLGMPSSLRGLWAARQRSHTRAAWLPGLLGNGEGACLQTVP